MGRKWALINVAADGGGGLRFYRPALFVVLNVARASSAALTFGMYGVINIGRTSACIRRRVRATTTSRGHWLGGLAEPPVRRTGSSYQQPASGPVESCGLK